MVRLLWRAASAGVLAAVLAEGAAGEQYHDYVDPTERPGLRRSVAQPDGSLFRFFLIDRASAVAAVQIDEQGAVLGEVDLSDAGLQADMLANERAVHGLAGWQPPEEAALAARHAALRRGVAEAAPQCAAPEDTHLEAAASELYEAAFLALEAPRSGRLLQLGGIGEQVEGDPAHMLLARHGLRGLVAAGNLPEGSPPVEGWTQGPRPEDVELSVEGGLRLLPALGEWGEADVIRLDQDLPGGCLLLQGLLQGGLRPGLVVTFVNGMFPPPLRYASLGVEGLPEALQGCSLSYLQDVLRPHSLHLARFSGAYAAFVDGRRLRPEVSPHGLDEFACYRASRVWGFRRAIPIDFVREWFFDFRGEGSLALWRRCWSNATAVASAWGVGIVNGAPPFLLHL